MNEKSIILDEIDPLDLWGSNNIFQKLLQQRFSGLKIISRGNIVKLSGKEKDIEKFSDELLLLVNYVRAKGKLTEQKFHELLHLKESGHDFHEKEQSEESFHFGEDNIIVHGPNGKVIRARTENQKKLVEYVMKNDIVFALGPAGTGKTYTAVALAVKALKNKEIKRIILARPAVEAGENLGFLPGDLKEKIDPYLRPLYDALDDMILADKLKALIESRVIEIAPMAFMRGRTLDNCFVILDEAQNATDMQLKMFLTRMGPHAKVIITGDLSQIDLPKKQHSGLLKAVRILKNIKGIKIAELSVNDVVRHKLVKEIIKAYDSENEEGK
ncbi:MAG: PhoH family protein [Bacteroidetes bacterium]|nr:MAG: PhoH family protein [Bacteroidota bacterium]